MHLKIRRRSAYLYRSSWVPRGTSGNTHGYAMQSYIGSISLDAVSIPPALRERLTDEELDELERRVCAPARQAQARAERHAHERAADPLWRINEAARLLGEAAELSRTRPVPVAATTAAARALDAVCLQPGTASAAGAQTGVLGACVQALQRAAESVQRGELGCAPSSGARATPAYAAWTEIVRLVNGPGSGTLVAALQDRGYVKRRRPSR